MRRCCLLAGRLPPPPLKIDALPGRLPPPPFADDGAALFMTKPVSRMECLNLSSESTAGFVGGFGAPPRGCVYAAMASGVASRTTICRALTARCCECFMAHGDNRYTDSFATACSAEKHENGMLRPILEQSRESRKTSIVCREWSRRTRWTDSKAPQFPASLQSVHVCSLRAHRRRR